MALRVELHLELYGGKWSASHPSHFSPGKRIAIHTEQQAGSAPKLDWKNLLPLPDIKMSTIQPAALFTPSTLSSSFISNFERLKHVFLFFEMQKST